MNLRLATLMVLFVAATAHAREPDTQAPASSEPQFGFTIKSMYRLENQVTLGIPEKAARENGILKAREEAGESIVAILTPIFKALSVRTTPDPDEFTEAILHASTALTEAAKVIGISHPELAATMNFIIYPAELSDGSGQGDENSFEVASIRNMTALKKSKFGRVIDGKVPLFPLGAAVSFRLKGVDGEVKLQVVTLINPQEIKGDTPVTIPDVKSPDQATVMFLEISQLLALKMPKLDLKFGKLGSLKRDTWAFHFDVAETESICSRVDSVPKLWQSKGIWLPLPIYQVTLDLNMPEIVAADVRLGLMGTCLKLWGIVSGEFIKEGNKKLRNATGLVSTLLGATPEELADMIAADRKASGIKPTAE